MAIIVQPDLVLKHSPPNLQQGDKPVTDMCKRKTTEDGRQLLYLLLGFKDITSEDIAGTISSDIAEDFQVLGVMRDVEDPGERATERHTECGIPMSTENL